MSIAKYFTQTWRGFIYMNILENQLNFAHKYKITGKASSLYFNLLYQQFGKIDHMEVLNCSDKTKIVIGSFYGDLENDGLFEVSKITNLIECPPVYSGACRSMFFRVNGKPSNRIFEVINEA